MDQTLFVLMFQFVLNTKYASHLIQSLAHQLRIFVDTLISRVHGVYAILIGIVDDKEPVTPFSLFVYLCVAGDQQIPVVEYIQGLQRLKYV
jgi:hypothetical protein